jgi:hypothetical protein
VKNVPDPDYNPKPVDRVQNVRPRMTSNPNPNIGKWLIFEPLRYSVLSHLQFGRRCLPDLNTPIATSDEGPQCLCGGYESIRKHTTTEYEA